MKFDEESEAEEENEDVLGTPPKIKDETDFLPEKSRARYEVTYTRFIKWQDSKKKKSFSEDMLLAYFEDVSKRYKPSSLWSHYSMLRCTLNNRHNVDISQYLDLSIFLKKQSVGYQSKKYLAFTAEELKKFLEEAPDEEYLAAKVIAIFGVHGATRNDELVSMMKSHVTHTDGVTTVRVADSKTFKIEGDLTKIVRKYEERRPKKDATERYFLNYQNGKCTNQVIGLPRFAKVPKQIANYLGLKDADKYTGYCFRRTSTSILADKGANVSLLKKDGLWKSDKLIDEYVQDSIGNKRKIANMISDVINCEVSASTSSSVAEKSRVEKKQKTIEADSDVLEDATAVKATTATDNANIAKEKTKCNSIIKEELVLEECGETLDKENHSEVIDQRENREKEILAKNNGKAYINRQGQVIPARSIKKLCASTAKNPCDSICGKKLISEKDRQRIFRHFWDLPNRTQKYEYIARHIRLMKPKKTKTDNTSKRTSSYMRFYFLPINGKLRRVCAKTFIATLDITWHWILFSIQKFSHLSLIKLFDSEQPPPLVPIRSVTNQNLTLTDENNVQVETKVLSVNPDPVHNLKKDSEADEKKEIQQEQAVEVGLSFYRRKRSKRPRRSVRKGCNNYCIFNCHTITEEQRQRIFRDFWSIGDRFGKYAYISRLVEQKAKECEIKGFTRLRRRRKYFLEVDGQFKRVCHVMFLATLDISLCWVCSAVKHLGPRAVISVNDIEDNGIPGNDIDPIL